MLPRIFIVLVLGGFAAYVAMNWWRQRPGKDHISGRELKALRQSTLGAEAASLRQKIHAHSTDESLQGDVDDVLRAMFARQQMRKDLATSALDLRTPQLEQKLASLELELESARSPSDEELAQKRIEQLTRQNALADTIDEKIAKLDAGQERLVVELRDVHLAVIAHRAKSTEQGDLAHVRERLMGASDHLRLEAEALDEVQALMVERQEFKG